MNYFVADDYSVVIRFVFIFILFIIVIKVTGDGSGEGTCPLPRNFLINSTVDMLFWGKMAITIL